MSNASSFASATSSLITSASMAAGATMGIGCSRFLHNARFSSLQSNTFDGGATAPVAGGSAGVGGSPSHLGQATGTPHVCKKISLPAGGLARALQPSTLERPKASRIERMKSMAGAHHHSVASDPIKPKLQRTESCSTVSDVDSINEHIESLPGSSKKTTTDTDDGRAPMARSNSQLAEEQSGDRYDTSDTCCNCSHLSKKEQRRREALWELFQSDLFFLTDHLMVLKNVFMEPLKKIQVEGYAMFAEPEVLFGNLDELCLVVYAFCREFLNILTGQLTSGEMQIVPVLVKLFQQSGRASALTQAYHRYTLNYINALTYLETLRRQIEFTEFEKVRRLLFCFVLDCLPPDTDNLRWPPPPPSSGVIVTLAARSFSSPTCWWRPCSM